MTHCRDCDETAKEVTKSEITARHVVTGAGVWECPHCGAILGVSDRA